MEHEEWWQTVGRHTSNHHGISERSWNAALKSGTLPTTTNIQSTPCSYCGKDSDDTVIICSKCRGKMPA